MRCYQRALKANPLDRGLREAIKSTGLNYADELAAADQNEEARQQYQTALTYAASPNDAEVLARWAACEFKSKHPDTAEALIQRGLNGNRTEFNYFLLVESIRKKLPPKLKKRASTGSSRPPSPAPRT